MTDKYPVRAEIDFSWSRSSLSGLRPESAPRLDQKDVDPPGSLTRAAGPVLAQLAVELGETVAVVILADHEARIMSLHCMERPLLRTISSLGVVPGARFGEDNIGTNAIGTPLEVRRPVAVRGHEHFNNAFKGFSCYGHPIIHPVTRRLHGILDVSYRCGDEHLLFELLLRRVAREIEERLQADSPQSHQRLVAAFRQASRAHNRAVVALGHEIVLATPAALDLLEAPDYATLWAYAGAVAPDGAARHRLALTSGLVVRLDIEAVGRHDGVLIGLVPQDGGTASWRRTQEPDGWPLLVIGEPGSGRTTAALGATGNDPAVIDAADVLSRGEEGWAGRCRELLDGEGPAVIIENIQLLSERLTIVLARWLRATARRVVLTSTPGDHVNDVHAALTGLCADRRDLLPLRLRRPEIPGLAQRMLAATTAAGRVRLTSATLRILTAQPWPGNLTELQRVIDTLTMARSAGDITPADIPASHRRVSAPGTPFEQAEADVIVAAIRAAGGNKLRAAQALGVSRSTLYNRLHALHLES